jgi:DNA (cytosine-5)-methyltransferase 1
MLEFGALAKRLQTKWLVWENVPGVLSSNGGRDFGSFLAMLAELGYGFAYRVLDAQHFGVPQRRRRLFVIGCLGDHRSAAAVLFEQHSLQGHIAPSREKGEEVAGTITRGAFSGGASGRPEGAAANHFLKWLAQIAPTLNASFGSKQGLENQHINGGGDYSCHIAKTLVTKTRLDSETETLITCGGYFDNPTYALAGNTIGRKPENGGNGIGYDDSGVSFTLTKTDIHAVAFNAQGSSSQGDCVSERITPTLDKSKTPAVMHKMQVRRLMPIECERLQGFPDNFTNIPGASDSARYKALGNSMAVPCMSWLGKRIDMVEKMQMELAA